jgi:hypothetical protein
MSAELLSSVAGIVLSLIFSYIPGIKEWFEPLANKYKQALIGGLLVVVAVAIFGLACAGITDAVTCDKPGALDMVELLIVALVANQSAYLLTKPDK